MKFVVRLESPFLMESWIKYWKRLYIFYKIQKSHIEKNYKLELWYRRKQVLVNLAVFNIWRNMSILSLKGMKRMISHKSCPKILYVMVRFHCNFYCPKLKYTLFFTGGASNQMALLSWRKTWHHQIEWKLTRKIHPWPDQFLFFEYCSSKQAYVALRSKNRTTSREAYMQ